VKNSLTVAAIQMVSVLDWQKNLDTAQNLIQQAAEKGAELVVLPEFFIRIANTQDTEFANITETLGIGKIQSQLALIAKTNHIYLVAGTIPIKCPTGGKCYNTTLVYNPDGLLICHYHKIHLFKFQDHKYHFDESLTFQSGSDVVTFTINGFCFGLTICYDLRFPELFRRMAGVDAIILPAAFVHHTGQAHWEILLRARAIENQCYVIASGQGGMHENGRHTFGHSMIVDPWGTIKAVLADGEGVILSKMEKREIEQIRKRLPALEHRSL